MCLYPTLIRNKKYLPTKKNNYNPPECNDNRKKYVPVGCGVCIECRRQKARNWQIRLTEEIEKDKTGKFYTLTFNEESLNNLEAKYETKDANIIATKAVRLFLERWRKKYKKSVKHWLITELGHDNTERLHIHGIIFTNESKEKVEKIWKYGWTHRGEYINSKSINYFTKYITKTDRDHPDYIPKILCTPGMGKSWTESLAAKKAKEKDIYRYKNGHIAQLPIYYRNKIYTEEEKEEKWTELLDKQERYVLGQKIDVSTQEGEIEYEEALKYAQEINCRTGNLAKIQWEKKSYETRKNKLKICNN